MANINIRKRIENISNDLEELIKHVKMYSGIDARDAVFVDNVATDIAAEAADLASIARAAQGQTGHSSLVKRVRKALGFTYP